jgi:hypothetical protein
LFLQGTFRDLFQKNCPFIIFLKHTYYLSI